MKQKNTVRCSVCGKPIRTFSLMRKYCYDCRIHMRKEWVQNTKKKE